jgi:hypothetical protein
METHNQTTCGSHGAPIQIESEALLSQGTRATIHSSPSPSELVAIAERLSITGDRIHAENLAKEGSNVSGDSECLLSRLKSIGDEAQVDRCVVEGAPGEEVVELSQNPQLLRTAVSYLSYVYSILGNTFFNMKKVDRSEEIPHVELQFQAANDEIAIMSNRVRQYADQFDTLVQKYSLLSQELQKLKVENLNIRTDNEELRAQLVSLQKWHGPLEGEEYYTELFKALNSEIGGAIAGQVKKVSRQTQLEVPEWEILSTRIAELGNAGVASVNFLNSAGSNVIDLLFSSGASRIAFIRHIISLLLYERVFEPFAFGLSGPFSETLKVIQQKSILQGAPPRGEFRD